MDLNENISRVKKLMNLLNEEECRFCDERTKKVIQSLNPKLQLIAKKFVDEVKTKTGLDIVIASGLRTPEKQDQLYCKGRPKDEYCIIKKLPTKGKIVTNRKGGESIHNSGKAFDAYFKKNGVIDVRSNITPEVAKIGKDLGLIWGGDWTDFTDYPHFEIK